MPEKQQIETIFGRAIEIASSQKRAAFLQQACQDDHELRREVERLVGDFFRAGEFLQDPVAHVDSQALADAFPNLVGQQIGSYTIREQIGEGGMGVVYVGEQTAPISRKVALKIVKPGMATRDVVARFEAERQALAMMDHAYIARVFDGGVTDLGQPYFVMELVQGLPITEYCDQQQLGVIERLQLFLKVCRAVHHAHQKGIIHRDLKPSNVLVPRIDDEAVPKVIDFGVAKAVGHKLSEHTVYTRFSQLVGTPLYMSPEQTELGVVDVDTRSDVYSLGVLLYELLAGRPPFDRDTLSSASFDEMRRMIREQEPRRPSMAVRDVEYEVTSAISECRSATPQKLVDSLRGELDWVVMKALEKDRDRRYESASALADDIERYMGNQPVVAKPASAIYRIQKFAQRNRSLAASLAVLACAIVAIVLVTVAFSIRSQRMQRETARRLYSAEMMQAAAAWEANDYGSLSNFLRSTMPQPDLPDFRGWEWYFLDEQSKRPFAVTPGKHVRRVAWNPRKSELAVVVRRTVSESAIEVWKPGKRSPLRTVAELIDVRAVRSLTWSAKGNRIAFGASGGRAVVLDATTGATLFNQQVHRGTGDRGHTRVVDLSPTEDILATGSRFGQIATWDIDTGELIDLISEPTEPDNLNCLAFSPDGRKLAAALRFGARAVWDLGSVAAPTLYDRISNGSLGIIRWSADGTRLASADGFKIAVYRQGTAKPTVVFWHRDVRDICWVDDQTLVSCGADQTLRFWDLREQQELRTMRMDGTPLFGVSVSADRRFLAARSATGSKVIHLTDRLGYHEMLKVEPHEHGTHSAVRWSRDGHKLALKHYATAEDEFSLRTQMRVFDVRTWQLIAQHDNVGTGHGLNFAWAPGDDSILEVNHDGRRYELGVTDPSLREFSDDLGSKADDIEYIAVNQKRGYGYLAVAIGNEVQIHEPGRRPITDRVEIPSGYWSVRLAWAPDGRLLLIAYVLNRNIHLQVYDSTRRQVGDVDRTGGRRRSRFDVGSLLDQSRHRRRACGDSHPQR